MDESSELSISFNAGRTSNKLYFIISFIPSLFLVSIILLNAGFSANILYVIISSLLIAPVFIISISKYINKVREFRIILFIFIIFQIYIFVSNIPNLNNFSPFWYYFAGWIPTVSLLIIWSLNGYEYTVRRTYDKNHINLQICDKRLFWSTKKNYSLPITSDLYFEKGRNGSIFDPSFHFHHIFIKNEDSAGGYEEKRIPIAPDHEKGLMLLSKLIQLFPNNNIDIISFPKPASWLFFPYIRSVRIKKRMQADRITNKQLEEDIKNLYIESFRGKSPITSQQGLRLWLIAIFYVTIISGLLYITGLFSYTIYKIGEINSTKFYVFGGLFIISLSLLLLIIKYLVLNIITLTFGKPVLLISNDILVLKYKIIVTSSSFNIPSNLNPRIDIENGLIRINLYQNSHRYFGITVGELTNK